MSGQVERSEDMSPDGALMLTKQDDGDVIVTLLNARDTLGRPIKNPIISVEFCSPGSGGGRSPHTIEALRNLFEAMEKDNQMKR